MVLTGHKAPKKLFSSTDEFGGIVFTHPRPSAELNQLVSWQRLQRHVSQPIPERLFVLVHNPAPAIDGQPLGGNGRAGDVAAQAFQAAALVRLADRGGVEGEAGVVDQEG